MPSLEFCCRSGGSNLNAGTRTGSSTEPGTTADFTYASGTWVASTGVFTVASGNPLTDGVAVGDFASVYADGASVTGFVGRVTARDATTITVSLTVKSGTPPTDGTSSRTLKIGGAWAGPNGAIAFPFNFIQYGFGSSLWSRINFKNDQTYSITASLTVTEYGTAIWQGYTSTYGDGGRAIIDGGTSGASYILLNITTSGRQTIADLIFRNNGATGNAHLVDTNGLHCVFYRCVFTGGRGAGINLQVLSALSTAVECEAYGNNLSDTANLAGFLGGVCFNCISHDHTTSQSSGFGYSSCHGCISDSNVLGFNACSEIINCDSYNNGGGAAGFGGERMLVISSNFIKSAGYGISSASGVSIVILNCGFGSGTQANTSGNIDAGSTASAIVEGSVIYPANVTPWVDPANGDFRIVLPEARGAGRGAYMQTATGYSGTVGYADIGAAQSQGGNSPLWAIVGG